MGVVRSNSQGNSSASSSPQAASCSHPQTANGNVEAKVVCLFRRRDISSSLNSLADSNARECWGPSP